MGWLAYFLTWHTYGTWLHGDERGSVDIEHNQYGTPRLPPDATRMAGAAERMVQDAFVLSAPMQKIVTEAIRDHAAVRGWRVVALNVRSNHVHLGLRDFGAYSAERVMDQCKSWSTRRLIEAGFVRRGRRVWTRHGSTRFISTDKSLCAMIDYVMNQQDRFEEPF